MHPGGRETCLLQPSLPQADRCLRRLLLGVFPNWLFTPVLCRALHLALGSKPHQEDKLRALSSKASLGLAKVDITRRDGVKCRKNKTKNAWRIIGRRGPLGGLRVSWEGRRRVRSWQEWESNSGTRWRPRQLVGHPGRGHLDHTRLVWNERFT